MRIPVDTSGRVQQRTVPVNIPLHRGRPDNSARPVPPECFSSTLLPFLLNCDSYCCILIMTFSCHRRGSVFALLSQAAGSAIGWAFLYSLDGRSLAFTSSGKVM